MDPNSLTKQTFMDTQSQNDKLSPKLPTLGSLRNRLWYRARHAIEELGVTSVQQFLALREKDVMNLWHCGKHTWREMANQQRQLARKLGQSEIKSAQTPQPLEATEKVTAWRDEAVTREGLAELPIFSGNFIKKLWKPKRGPTASGFGG